MLRHFKLYKQEIEEIKKSQYFSITNFDQAIKSIKELKEENMELRKENENLRTLVDKLDNNIIANEQEVESLKQYRRLGMLEFHGILVLEDEATNEIILKVAHLVDPEHLLQDDDISIRHPLPSREGAIPPIIVKFCRRNMRDRIYNARRELSTKTAQDLAFPHNNKLYINESLTPKLRELLYKVKTFKRNNQFKFVWTRNGN